MKKKLSRLITCMLLLSILFPLITLEAALSSPNPESIALLNNYSSGASDVNIGQGYQRVLSNYPQLALNINLNAGTGNKISKIEFLKYGVPINIGVVANNTQTQTISKVVSGEAKNVVSGFGTNLNTTAKGYYSWYRYSSGPFWFADIPPTGQNSSNPSNCGPSVTCFGDPGEYDEFNGTYFWKFPNVSSNLLTMSGTRSLDYVLEDSISSSNPTDIPIDFVSNSPAYFSGNSVADTTVTNILGGFGEFGNAGSVSGTPITTMTNNNHYTVKFSKSFTEAAFYKDTFTAPGAAWMDWFFAFKTTLKSKTFVYPDQIRVTYAQVGVATLVVTPDTATVLVGSTNNYIATYTDTGGISSTVTNSSTWSNNNNTIATINSTGLATGKVDGTVTIMADYNGLTATAELIVTSGATPTPTPTPTPIPELNRPPYIRIAWYKHGEATESSTVNLNTNVDLRVVGDSISIPASPSDPDGDPVIISAWDFNSSTVWVNSLPGTYNLNTGISTIQFMDMVANIPGDHTVFLTVHDPKGATYTASANLHVIDPKPIACIDAPLNVKAGRPIPYAITSCSYSPVNAAITTETWTNKLTQYNTAGTEVVKLKVQDSAGRWSGEVTKNINVIPDQPPIAVLNFPAQTTRGSTISIDGSLSSSPDGDTITQYYFEYQYDAANDGYANDSWQLLYSGVNKNVNFAPIKIGKYNFRLTVTENFGQKGSTTKILDTLNLAPTVNVQTSGQTGPPSTVTPISMSTVFNSWPVTNTIGGTAGNKANWYMNSGSLTTKIYDTLYAIRKPDDGMWSRSSYYPFALPQKLVTPTSTTTGSNFDGAIADEKYVYAFKYTGGQIRAYDKNLNLVWTITAPYTGDLTTYKGKLYFSNSNFISIYDRDTGTLLNSATISNGTSLKIFDNKVIVTAYSNVYVYDINLNYIGVYPAAVTRSGSTAVHEGENELEGTSVSYYSGYVTKVRVADQTVVWRTPLDIPSTSGDVTRNETTGNYVVTYGSQPDVASRPTKYNIAEFSQTGVLISNSLIALQGGLTTPIFYPYASLSTYAYIMTSKKGITYLFSVVGTGPTIYAYDSSGSLISNTVLDMSGTYVYSDAFFGSDGTYIVRINHKQSQISGADYTYFYAFDPSGSNYYKFYAGGDPFVLPFADQKLLVVTGATSYSLYDSSSSALLYPNSLNLGEPFSNIWTGPTYLSNQIMKLNINASKSSIEGVGLAFRVQDSQNYLSAEFENGLFRFKKTVNGTSTVLNEVSYLLSLGNNYRIKVVPNGSSFDLYVNDIPVMTVSDTSWSTGKMAIINRGYQGIGFNGMSYETGLGASGSFGGVALINSPITNTVTFTDPENDPRLTQSESWTYTHNPNIFLNPLGTWGSSGSSFSTAVTSFPLPGEYTFVFKSRDDPNSAYKYPSMIFDPYRHWSNTLTGKIRAHRKPISDFSVSFNANSTINWIDTSYDPDRFNPSNNSYSTEATGINYQATRGVLDRQYYYISPSGVTTNVKLTKPAEYGIYTVGMAVKDEYNAWSDWTERTIFIANPVPNNLPVANIIDPSSSSSSSPTIYATLKPLYKWTYSDADGDPQQRYIFNVYESANNIVYTSSEVLSSALQWQQPVNLAENVVYSVQVQAHDGTDYSLLSAKKFFKIVINTPPTAVIYDPASTDSSNPTVYSLLRPIYKWTYTDADGDSQQRFTLNVYNSSNAIVYTSGEVLSSAFSWQQPTDLSANVVYSVQVQVHDGKVYSGLSAKKYFKINRPPIGNISFTIPIYQNDTPQFSITQSDPDGDALTIKVDSSFNGGGYSNVKQWTSVASGTSKSFTLGPLAQGVYSLRLTLDDGGGGIYTQTYTFTALPLFLSGAIKHTAIWESNRLQWNVKFPAKIRATDVFWAGEALELFATATDTGTSLTKPLNVSAKLVQTGDSVSLTSSDQIHYVGEMVNTDFIHSLEDGLYTMQFQIQWSNGMIQKTDVPFYIRGNILDVIVVQLRN
ncbi:hypothetical protein EHS13_05995 [Paenibacillus psychroresistens]|uniref:BIG2 domain-containing protein n=1 Tax=Paenibacillus psychroresistens TaxID=1778678 RepID=A0A6B8REX4_9BACL|nr:hypothetical protein [Paenibacillus psychroresistens]QGQ94487.1 hypothetical protein EHS13_05995 [Paenibacillus psychroresistens]